MLFKTYRKAALAMALVASPLTAAPPSGVGGGPGTTPPSPNANAQNGLANRPITPAVPAPTPVPTPTPAAVTPPISATPGGGTGNRPVDPGSSTGIGNRPIDPTAAPGLVNRPVTPATGPVDRPAPAPNADAGLSRRPITPGPQAGLELRPANAASAAGLSRRPTDSSAGNRLTGEKRQTSPQNRPEFSLNAPGRTDTERPHLFGRVFGHGQRDLHAVGGRPDDVAGVASVGDAPTAAPEFPQNGRGRPAEMPAVAHGGNRMAFTHADRLLAQRLAQIDHLRDVALRNGNAELLSQADVLEAQARDQYDRRLAAVPSTEPAPVEPTPDSGPESPSEPAPEPGQDPVTEPTPDPLTE